MKNHYYKPLIIVALCSLVGLSIAGCEEEELYTLSQEEEVERYIDDSYLGRTFFPNDFPSDGVSFTFPGDDTLYTVIFDRSSRSFTISHLGDTIGLQTGYYYYCYATLSDGMYFTLRKNISGQVIESSVGDEFSRFGFLVKIGDNDQAYSGWLLQAVSARPQDVLDIETIDGTRLRMNYSSPLIVEGAGLSLPYPTGFDGLMDIDNISMIDDSSEVAIDTCGPCVTIAYYETGSGYAGQVLPDIWSDPSCYVDTFMVGAASEVVWTSLSLQTFCRVNDSTITHSIRYIPFKVDH